MGNDASNQGDAEPPVLDYRSSGAPPEAEPGEQVFLAESDTLITDVRLVFGGKTFVLDQVVCLEMLSDVPPGAEHVLPCIVAIDAVAFGIVAAVRSGFIYALIALLAAAGLLFAEFGDRRPKDSQALWLQTTGGRLKAIGRLETEAAARIVAAMNRALIARRLRDSRVN